MKAVHLQITLKSLKTKLNKWVYNPSSRLATIILFDFSEPKRRDYFRRFPHFQRVHLISILFVLKTNIQRRRIYFQPPMALGYLDYSFAFTRRLSVISIIHPVCINPPHFSQLLVSNVSFCQHTFHLLKVFRLQSSKNPHHFPI